VLCSCSKFLRVVFESHEPCELEEPYSGSEVGWLSSEIPSLTDPTEAEEARQAKSTGWGLSQGQTTVMHGLSWTGTKCQD
jgi:hypothetical protein